MIAPVGAWGDELVRLEQQIAFLEVQSARLSAELAEGTPGGFVSMVDWMRFNCHLTSTVAADRINVGRHIDQMPESVEALRKGGRRRAPLARDQHCRWPDCERPAAWCDAHHVRHWAHGGGGEIENQVLLCRRHHRMVHEGRWQLIRSDGGSIVTVAPTVTFGRARSPN